MTLAADYRLAEWQMIPRLKRGREMAHFWGARGYVHPVAIVSYVQQLCFPDAGLRPRSARGHEIPRKVARYLLMRSAAPEYYPGKEKTSTFSILRSCFLKTALEDNYVLESARMKLPFRKRKGFLKRHECPCGLRCEEVLHWTETDFCSQKLNTVDDLSSSKCANEISRPVPVGDR